jgi:ATP-dependent DNA helicase RecG
VRRDTPTYPWGALREGVMNALTHRDYAAFDGQLSIQIKSAQIEIWNPGRLPEGMTVQDLPRGHVSRPPNPNIAHVFFLRGLIERVGIGTQRIVQECQAAGLPDPVWELRAGGVSLTLRLPASILSERQVAFLRLPLRTPFETET